MGIKSFFSNIVTRAVASQVVTMPDKILMTSPEFNRAPFNKTRAIALLRSWAYISCQANARMIAATPLRLYKTVKNEDDFPKYAPFKSIRKDRQLMLKEVYPEAGSEEDEVVEITEHPFLDLMQSVNPFRNGTDFKEETIMFQQGTGDAFWYVVKGTGLLAGIPQELWLLQSQNITIVPDEKLFVKGYIYGSAGQKIALRPDEVIHFREPNIKNQYYGMGRLEAVYDAAENMEAMDFSDSRMAKNPIPSVIASFEGITLSPKQRREYAREFENMLDTQARNRSNLMGIEDNIVKFRTLSFTPKDLQFPQGRQWRREEIVNAFGQSVALYTDTASRANVDGAIYKWATAELDPSAVKFAEKINEKLLPMYDGGTGSLFCAFDKISKADGAFMIAQDSSDIQNKIRTINEVRTARGLPKIEDERADDVFYAPAPTLLNPNQQESSGNGAEETDDLTDREKINGKMVHPDLADSILTVYP